MDRPEIKLTKGQRLALCVGGAVFILVGGLILQQYFILTRTTEVYGSGIDPRMLFLVFAFLLTVMGLSAVAAVFKQPSPPIGEFSPSPRRSPRRGYVLILLVGMIGPLLFVMGSAVIASLGEFSPDVVPQAVAFCAVLIGGFRLAWMAWRGEMTSRAKTVEARNYPRRRPQTGPAFQMSSRPERSGGPGPTSQLVQVEK